MRFVWMLFAGGVVGLSTASAFGIDGSSVRDEVLGVHGRLEAPVTSEAPLSGSLGDFEPVRPGGITPRLKGPGDDVPAIPGPAAALIGLGQIVVLAAKRRRR